MKISFGKLLPNRKFNWRYIIPRAMLLDCHVKESGYQQYQWLGFYFTIQTALLKEGYADSV